MKEQSESSKKELIEELSREINSCKKCELWKTRNKPLIGDGSVDAKILMIGESPGYNEDIQGRAFVGDAGRILDQLLALINLKRSDIYITNIFASIGPSPTRGLFLVFHNSHFLQLLISLLNSSINSSLDLFISILISLLFLLTIFMISNSII